MIIKYNKKLRWNQGVLEVGWNFFNFICHLIRLQIIKKTYIHYNALRFYVDKNMFIIKFSFWANVIFSVNRIAHTTLLMFIIYSLNFYAIRTGHKKKKILMENKLSFARSEIFNRFLTSKMLYMM